jgi:hypothetical protein
LAVAKQCTSEDASSFSFPRVQIFKQNAGKTFPVLFTLERREIVVSFSFPETVHFGFPRKGTHELGPQWLNRRHSEAQFLFSGTNLRMPLGEF